MNLSPPNVGQASRLPSERASASGSVPSALPTEAGETPALHFGSGRADRPPPLLCLKQAARRTLSDNWPTEGTHGQGCPRPKNRRGPSCLQCQLVRLARCKR